MQRDLVKFIVSTVILVALIAVIVFSLISGIDLGFAKISSFSGLQQQHDNISTKQTSLSQKETSYKTTLQNLENAKTEYSKEKAKYEAISNETINMIKEATTEEKYTLEYMWIRLGNYAKIHNLSILLVEPGGSSTSTTTGGAGTPTGTTGTGTSTGTGTGTPTGTNTSTGTGTNATTGTSTGTGTPTGTTGTTGTNTTGTPSGNTTTASDVLRIEITGSYLNVSDFIFDVENDKELRFKLDNITMELVSGTTIKTTFNVKNMVINK